MAGSVMRLEVHAFLRAIGMAVSRSLKTLFMTAKPALKPSIMLIHDEQRSGLKEKFIQQGGRA